MEFIHIEIREEDGPVERRILTEVGKLHWAVHQLREELHAMSTTAVTKDQFDAALAALLQAEAARDAAVIQALKDLQDKVTSGQPIDLAAELANVLTLTTNAAAITQTATAADPGPTTVTTPPPPTPTA